MTHLDDTSQPASTTSNSTSTTDAGPATGAGGAVMTTAPLYPPYLLVFKGLPGQVKQVDGPHTDSLQIGNPAVDVTFEVSHNTTADGPNLTIQISVGP